MLTRKLGRKKAHRTHMLYNLAASVILHEKAETTEAKAKEVKKLIDRSVTIAKKQSLAARRQLEGMYTDSAVAEKLMNDLAHRFADRPSGYTRLLRTGTRHGDGADRSLILLIADEKSAESKKKAAKPAAKQEEKEVSDAK